MRNNFLKGVDALIGIHSNLVSECPAFGSDVVLELSAGVGT